MDVSLLISLVFALQILCFLVATFKSSIQRTKSSYYLASKKLTFIPLLMTFVATLIGGGSTLGAAEEAYAHGLIIFLYPLGGAVGFLLIALFFGKKLHALQATTLAETLQQNFNSLVLRRLASLLSIFALFSIFVGQIIATRKFLLSLDINSELVLVGFWLIVIVYTAWGGLKAVAYTDVVQGLFFIVVFGLAIVFIGKPVLFESLKPSFIQADYHIDKYSSWFLMPMLFMLIEQDIAQRCFGAKNASSVKKAAILAAIISLVVSMVPICLGIGARFHNLNLPLGSSVLICAVSEFMSPVMASFAGCAVIAAIVSTADSQLNAISSNIACDFSKNLKISKIRMLTLLIAACGLLCSYLFDNVIDVIIFSLELYICSCFVPIVAGICMKSRYKLAAFVSVLCGVISYAALRILALSYIPTAAIALVISALSYLVAFFICKILKFKSLDLS